MVLVHSQKQKAPAAEGQDGERSRASGSCQREALLAHATSTAVRRCVKADFALHEPCSKIFRVRGCSAQLHRTPTCTYGYDMND